MKFVEQGRKETNFQKFVIIISVFGHNNQYNNEQGKVKLK